MYIHVCVYIYIERERDVYTYIYRLHVKFGYYAKVVTVEVAVAEVGQRHLPIKHKSV